MPWFIPTENNGRGKSIYCFSVIHHVIFLLISIYKSNSFRIYSQSFFFFKNNLRPLELGIMYILTFTVRFYSNFKAHRNTV